MISRVVCTVDEQRDERFFLNAGDDWIECDSVRSAHKILSASVPSRMATAWLAMSSICPADHAAFLASALKDHSCN